MRTSIARLVQKVLYVPVRIKKTAAWCGIYMGLSPHSEKVNLGSGPNSLAGYCNIDVNPHADLIIDLEKYLLPFKNDSVEVVICMSAINYFTLARGQEIIAEVYRVLKPGGIARFGVQDLILIARKYVDRDTEFFGQKRPDGSDRFRGATIAEKFNAWFYGYRTLEGKGSRFFYDYETLELLFKKAGFNVIERKRYQESKLPDVTKIDNRPEQMFFLEAIK